MNRKEASLAEINLNCRSANPINIVPTFYTEEGTAIVGETFQMLPAEMRFIDVQTLIPAEHREKHKWGGMSLAYTGNTMEVWAQLTLHGVGKKGSTNALFAVVDAPRSNVLEAVWRMPKNATATIALGNYSDTPAGATLTFSNGDVEQVNLAPYATKIVKRKNNGQNRTDIEAESVRIDASGKIGRLIPTGLVVSNNKDYACSIRFHDTQKGVQPNLNATNFRIKNSTPRIVLKNTTINPITAKPRFLPATGESNVFELPQITIQPNEVKEVNLTPLVNAAKTRPDLDSVAVQIINNGGEAGSLIGAANFTNNATGVDYDIPLRDSGAARNSTGGYPVRLDGDYTTVLSITNVSEKTSKFVMQINYDGGPYALYPQDIAPGATKTFDIRKLRDEQTPDSSGRKLPRNLTVAQIRWSILGDGSTILIGRSEIISASGKVSSSYSCNTCCPNNPQYTWMNPGIYIGYLNETKQFIAIEQDVDCYGNLQSPYQAYGQMSWTSGDTSVATVNSLTGTATAISAGNALIEATWERTRWQEALTGTSCDPFPEPMSAMGEMEVRPPEVKFNNNNTFSVEKGGSKSITVTVSNRGNFQITLFLRKSNNQSTTGVTFDDGSTSKTLPNNNGNHTVTIKGVTTSNQLEDYAITARYDNNIYVAGNQNFTVSSLFFGENSACSGFDDNYLLVPKGGNNKAKAYITPSGATGNFKLEVATTPSNQVSVSPTTLNPNNAGIEITVTGGNTKGSFKVNALANQQNSTVASELNVDVKDRIDKTVVFYAVTEDGNPDVPPPTSNIPTATGLQTYLNNTWGKQANVYFTVEQGTSFEVNYDLNGDGKIDSQGNGSEPLAVLNTQYDTTKNFNIYFLGLGVKTRSDGSTPAAFTNVSTTENYYVTFVSPNYNGTRDYITAHEVGHLLGLPERTTGTNFLMYQADLSTSPCKIGKQEWDAVNP